MSKDLFSPLDAGAFALRNRIIMAPLTRSRADDNHVPTDIMATYYSQRASAGMIITEATMVMEGNSAFWREPGIYSDPHIEGWKKVADAVHAEGGIILMQLWHGGRACHSLLNGGKQPVAPSPIAITGDETHTPEGKKPYETPRELRDDELPAIVEGFAQAAANAKAAGFDGVEVHGANGYLLDQFLRSGSNQRTGAYGGSIENRARLLLEVLDALIAVWGADRVGVRISPVNSYNDMRDADPVALTAYLAREFDARGIAFLDLMRADFFGLQKEDVVTPARENFKGNLFLGMGYGKASGNEAIASGQAEAIVIGHHYVSNPDMVERLKLDAEIVEPDASTFYSPGPKGYTDYPFLKA
ncbi:MAG: alkene reductase [Verrucomicrobiales bacterium]